MSIAAVVLGYEQEAFIEQAVISILSQKPLPCQVILSDDCSSDATFEIMQDVVQRFQLKADIQVRKNSENLGICGHLNRVMELVRCDRFMVCAGDDVSLPGRVKSTLAAHARYPNMVAASFRHLAVDESGAVISGQAASKKGPNTQITYKAYMRNEVRHPSAATRSYSKRLYQVFGALAEDCPSEDSPMLLRSLLLGETRIFSDIVLHYRQHASNLTRSAMSLRSSFENLHAQHRRDLEKAIELGLIPSGLADEYRNLLEMYWSRRRVVRASFHEGVFGMLMSVVKETDVPFGERLRLLRRGLRQRQKKLAF